MPESLSRAQKEYRKFFSDKLAGYGVESPDDLSGAEKTDFFSAIKKEWPKERKRLGIKIDESAKGGGLLILERHNRSRLKLLESQEGVPEGMMRVTGVAAVCGIENRNGRVYSVGNYKEHIDLLQHDIEEGLYGELEHPEGFTIDMNRVSHKIEKLWIDESTGIVYITILLLDNEHGRTAQAVVKSGGKLRVSSRASGSVDGGGAASIDELITYDIVGTPGFSETALLKEGFRKITGKGMNESLAYIKKQDMNNNTKGASATTGAIMEKFAKGVQAWAINDLGSAIDKFYKVNEARKRDGLAMMPFKRIVESEMETEIEDIEDEDLENGGEAVTEARAKVAKLKKLRESLKASKRAMVKESLDTDGVEEAIEKVDGEIEVAEAELEDAEAAALPETAEEPVAVTEARKLLAKKRLVKESLKTKRRKMVREGDDTYEIDTKLNSVDADIAEAEETIADYEEEVAEGGNPAPAAQPGVNEVRRLNNAKGSLVESINKALAKAAREKKSAGR